MADLVPLSGVMRKSAFEVVRAVFDAERTIAALVFKT